MKDKNVIFPHTLETLVIKIYKSYDGRFINNKVKVYKIHQNTKVLIDNLYIYNDKL
jgi:hypothetical protein